TAAHAHAAGRGPLQDDRRNGRGGAGGDRRRGRTARGVGCQVFTATPEEGCSDEQPGYHTVRHDVNPLESDATDWHREHPKQEGFNDGACGTRPAATPLSRVRKPWRPEALRPRLSTGLPNQRGQLTAI